MPDVATKIRIDGTWLVYAARTRNGRFRFMGRPSGLTDARGTSGPCLSEVTTTLITLTGFPPSKVDGPSHRMAASYTCGFILGGVVVILAAVLYCSMFLLPRCELLL